jgi:hypothetical protein
MSILGLLAILLVLAGKPADAEEQGSSLLDERKMIMALNFADENSCLLANGDLIDGETRPGNTVYGKMPRARFEGTVPGGNPVGPESVMLVPSFSRETGRAIRYALGPQATSGKARSEHYLHVGEFNRTLREGDVLFDYHGPIGYTLNGKPESEKNSHSNSIREQQGIYQGAHPAKTSFHAVSIANVRIYEFRPQRNRRRASAEHPDEGKNQRHGTTRKSDRPPEIMSIIHGGSSSREFTDRPGI